MKTRRATYFIRIPCGNPLLPQETHFEGSPSAHEAPTKTSQILCRKSANNNTCKISILPNTSYQIVHVLVHLRFCDAFVLFPICVGILLRHVHHASFFFQSRDKDVKNVIVNGIAFQLVVRGKSFFPDRSERPTTNNTAPRSGDLRP